MGHSIELYDPEGKDTVKTTHWTSNYSRAVPNGIFAYHSHKGTCVARMIMEDILYLKEQGIKETDTTTKSWSWGTDDNGTKLPDEEFNWVLHKKLLGMLELTIQYPQCIWISDQVFEFNDYTDNSDIIFTSNPITDLKYDDVTDISTYEFTNKIPEYEPWEEHAYNHESIIYSHRPRIYEWFGNTFYNGQSDPHYHTITREKDIDEIIDYYESKENMENHIILWKEIAGIFRKIIESRGNNISYNFFPFEALFPVTLEG